MLFYKIKRNTKELLNCVKKTSLNDNFWPYLKPQILSPITNAIF